MNLPKKFFTDDYDSTETLENNNGSTDKANFENNMDLSKKKMLKIINVSQTIDARFIQIKYN